MTPPIPPSLPPSLPPSSYASSEIRFNLMAVIKNRALVSPDTPLTHTAPPPSLLPSLPPSLPLSLQLRLLRDPFQPYGRHQEPSPGRPREDSAAPAAVRSDQCLSHFGMYVPSLPPSIPPSLLLLCQENTARHQRRLDQINARLTQVSIRPPSLPPSLRSYQVSLTLTFLSLPPSLPHSLPPYLPSSRPAGLPPLLLPTRTTRPLLWRLRWMN